MSRIYLARETVIFRGQRYEIVAVDFSREPERLTLTAPGTKGGPYLVVEAHEVVFLDDPFVPTTAVPA